MKLGTFILAALCAATPAYADHQAMIQRYEHAYGEQPDPHLLTLIANEYRDAGKMHEAFAYYCSYIFTTPAGDDAEYVSQQVHKLRPGVESDQAACTNAPPVMHSEDIAVLASVPRHRAVISKREIIGAGMIALSIGAFGLALDRGNTAAHILQDEIGDKPGDLAPTELKKLQDQVTSNQNTEKWLLAAGGVALVGGGILYLIGRHDRLYGEDVIIAPSVTKHGGGLVLGGKF
jgi:hypothetical protein